MEKNVLKSLDLTKVDPKVKTALEAVFKANEVAIAKAARLERGLGANPEKDRQMGEHYRHGTVSPALQFGDETGSTGKRCLRETEWRTNANDNIAYAQESRLAA